MPAINLFGWILFTAIIIYYFEWKTFIYRSFSDACVCAREFEFAYIYIYIELPLTMTKSLMQ